MMNFNGFKRWLEGYLAGCGVESYDDLSKKQLQVIMEKLSMVYAEGPYYSYTYTYPNTGPTWLVGSTSGAYVTKNTPTTASNDIKGLVNSILS